MAQTTTKIEKMERDMKTKEDLKTVALGTSKINYLDPRITVAWCKRHEVPVEKVNIFLFFPLFFFKKNDIFFLFVHVDKEDSLILFLVKSYIRFRLHFIQIYDMLLGYHTVLVLHWIKGK